ncbi:MAG: amino acid adenylation domain-containing protein, partial [bacterium]|nr:amino acid adenylation domain-containing protein [bacterium]
EIKVSLADLFKYPTVRELAWFLKDAGKSGYTNIEPAEKREYYPLSSAQKRLYFLQQLEPAGTSYKMFLSMNLGTDVDAHRMQRELLRLMERHESLRTSFEMIGNESVQRVHETLDFEVTTYDLSQEGENAGKRLKEIIDGYVRPFDLTKAPLMRSGLIKLPDHTYTWMLDIHHIVSDGTSHGLLYRDLTALFSGMELEPLRLQYRDFSQWQLEKSKSGALKEQEQYWRKSFQGDIPQLEIPGDFKRPEVFTFKGGHCSFSLRGEDAVGYRKLGATAGGTLYMNMLAALNVLFYKYTGQQDIILGTGISGRPHADLQQIIGMFVNTLPIRNFPAPHKSYLTLLEEAVTHSLEAFQNQDIQFDELVDRLEVERDPSRNPLCDICLVVQNFGPSRDEQAPAAGAASSHDSQGRPPGEQEKNHSDGDLQVGYKHSTSKFDMTFFIEEQGNDFACTIEYYSGIFKEETIRRLASHLKTILRTVTARPSILLKDVDILSDAEREQLVYGFNDTAFAYDSQLTIPDLFVQQVAKTPDSFALTAGSDVLDNQIHLTYRELYLRARRISDYLVLHKRIAPQERVGLLLTQSLYRAVSILGTLGAGGAYVPMDPALPRERIRYMVKDAGITLIISEKKYLATLNRLLWECDNLSSYICLDSENIHQETEQEHNQLMDTELWHHVGETAVDEISGGGWVSSYTGEPFSRAEMDEYGDNVIKKLEPLFHKQMRVLEIGAASGITMFRSAPKVGLYYGTDLSRVIIEKNKKRTRQEGHQNIRLACLPAHDIANIDQKDFDLIIINSVIQCFHGYNYLRKVIRMCIDLLGDNGHLFIGDIMDLEKKDALVNDLTNFKHSPEAREKEYTTKTDVSSELFVSRGFWQDLGADFGEIQDIGFSDKLFTIANELTKFRYDALITINKQTQQQKKRRQKRKHQEDARCLIPFGDRPELEDRPHEELEDGPHEELGDRPHEENGYGPENSGASNFNNLNRAVPSGLAYIIYTSGTTGRPKGVEVEHRGVVNTLCARRDQYKMGPGDAALQLFSYAFDGFVSGFFTPLVSGSRLVCLEHEAMGDIDAIRSVIIQQQITHFIAVPHLYSVIISSLTAPELSGLKAVTLAGDMVSNELLERTKEKNRDLEIVNEYGVTEVSVMSTIYRNQQHDEIIKIGVPIRNTQLYILSDTGQIQPTGVPGELCIAGAGLARGYMNNPELTADKFISPPSSLKDIKEAGTTRLYRTGDLARWTDNGTVRFIGRIDQQVKIRGFRLEPGEIENQLLGHEFVKEAVVVSRRESGDNLLCAYIIPHIQPTESNGKDESPASTALHGQLRDHLARSLPEYMVPAFFVTLDSFPLTAGGKIDRKKLPKPGINTSDTLEKPQNQREVKLLSIWSEILGVEEEAMGIDSNFFQIGGHSLKATILTSKIHKEMGVKIPLAEVFKHQTIRKLAETIRIRDGGGEKYRAILPVEKKEYYRLSSAQKRMYFLQQMDLNSTAYNMSQVWPLGREVDRDRLENVLKQLVLRHESLRTSFEMLGDEVVQRVNDSVEFKMEYIESSATSSNQNGEEAAPVSPFDLGRAPLMRSLLTRESDGCYSWLVDMHHIVSDGTSHMILTEDFAALYNNRPLPPLRLQYKDFSEWQNHLFDGGDIENQKKYWLELHHGEIPVLDMPVDYKRPEVFTFTGARCGTRLEPEVSKAFEALTTSSGGTLYMNILAIINTVLYRYSGQPDIIIGTGIAGRPHADLQKIIGMFINTLPMRNYPQGEKTYAGFLKEVITHSIDAFENQDVQFEEMVDMLDPVRDPSRNPIFDISMVVQNFQPGRPPADTGDTVDTVDNGNSGDNGDTGQNEYPQDTARQEQEEGPGSRTAKFDITFHVTPQPGGIDIGIEYYTGIFKADTITRLASHIHNTIAHVAKEPSVKLKDIQLISMEEKQRLLFDFNDTATDYPTGKTIHQLFEEQAEKTPDAPAVLLFSEGDRQLTYRELNARANQLAGYLVLSKNTGPEDRVGILASDPIDIAVYILGTLKAGAAYIPFEPSLPAERIRFMIEDSRSGIVLSGKKHIDILNRLSEDCRYLHSIFCMDTEGLENEEDVAEIRSNTVVDDARTLSGFCIEPLHVTVSCRNAAYIVYTSGTTGLPKGVVAEHVGVVNTLYARREAYGLDSRHTALQLFSYAFDGFVTGFFTPLICGARLVLLPPELSGDIDTIREAVVGSKVTHFIAVPPLYSAIIASLEPDELSSLETVTLAGDKVDPELLVRTVEKNANLEIVNEYGVTEASVMSTIHRDQQKHATISIGRPIANTQLYIINANLMPQPIGVPGELCIAGAGPARGYMNNPELTAEKFIAWEATQATDPTSFKNACEASPHTRLYKSGDLARWLPDGTIQFLGRIDQQVKIRGFRIETGEIESVLKNHNAVKEAAVTALEASSGDHRLYAYYVSATPKQPEHASLKDFLARKLPEYMLPTDFIPIEKIPRTAGAKVDTKALPAPGHRESKKTFTAPRNHMEKNLAAVWADVLAIPREGIGIDDDFFKIGGHSLKATILTSKIHKQMGVKIPLAEVFKNQTIRRLAETIRAGKSDGDKYRAIRPVEKREYYPLSSAQKRMYFLQQIDTNSIAYNMPQMVPLGKEVDHRLLENVLQQLIRRHESLRTSFERIGDQVVQRVHDAVEFNMEYRLSPVPGEREFSRTAADAVTTPIPGAMPQAGVSDLSASQTTSFAPTGQSIARPFDLGRAPLLRSLLIKDADGDYSWFVDMHHIISDGTSHMVLTEDFFALYENRSLPPLRLQYKDFSEWQNQLFDGSEIKTRENFWLNLYKGDIPPLDMPVDYKRPEVFTFAGAAYGFTLEPETTAGLKKLTSLAGGTLYMNILALINTVLFRYTGQSDIIIGTGIAGRPHADLQKIIGMFINTLPMRNHPEGAKPYDSFFKEVIAHSIDAFENQDVQFEELVDMLDPVRDPSRNPIFDISMVVQNFQPASVRDKETTAGQDTRSNETPQQKRVGTVENQTSKFDITFQLFEQGGEVNFTIEYYTGIFKADTIKRLSSHIQ